MSTSINGTTGIDVSAVSSSAITADRTSTDGTIIDLQKDGTSVGSIGTAASGTTNEFGITSNTGQLILGTSSTTNHVELDNVQLYPSPDATMNLGVSSLRWKDLYLSGGVYLGGTGSSNLLQDYETGNWTPTQGNFSTWTSPTFDAQYTKIGRMVFINLYQTGGTIGWSATQYMAGLPFAPSRGASAYATDNTPSDDNGPVLLWTSSTIWFQKGGSENGLVLSGMYYTS